MVRTQTQKNHLKDSRSIIRAKLAKQALVTNQLKDSIWDIDQMIAESTKKNIVVLDFDGTLVSQFSKCPLTTIKPRPYLQEFLRSLSAEYEFAGYSAAKPKRSAYILYRYLYPYVKYCFPRTAIENGKKKIKKIEEKFKEIWFIEDREDYVEQKETIKLVKVSSWKGNKDDYELRKSYHRIKGWI